MSSAHTDGGATLGEHDCVFEEDHDGGMTCPVCGRYEDDDQEDDDQEDD